MDAVVLKMRKEKMKKEVRSSVRDATNEKTVFERKQTNKSDFRSEKCVR